MRSLAKSVSDDNKPVNAEGNANQPNHEAGMETSNEHLERTLIMLRVFAGLD